MKHILLMSGGLDSTTMYFDKIKNINFDHVIYIDYGNKFIDIELERVRKIVDNVEVLKISSLLSNETGFFYGRNLEFFLAIRKRFIDEHICVYFGNVADDNYSDNTREYLYRVEKILNDSFPHKTMRISCPLAELNKAEVVALYKQVVPVDIKPYWCDTGDDEPCGKCHSCQAMIDVKLLEV